VRRAAKQKTLYVMESGRGARHFRRASQINTPIINRKTTTTIAAMMNAALRLACLMLPDRSLLVMRANPIAPVQFFPLCCGRVPLDPNERRI
jgi:hypothetical protein